MWCKYLTLFFDEDDDFINYTYKKLCLTTKKVQNIEPSSTTTTSLPQLLLEIQREQTLAATVETVNFIACLVCCNDADFTHKEDYKDLRIISLEKYNSLENVYKPKNYHLYCEMQKIMGKGVYPPPLVTDLKSKRILEHNLQLFKNYNKKTSGGGGSNNNLPKKDIITEGFLYAVDALAIIMNLCNVLVSKELFLSWLTCKNITNPLDFLMYGGLLNQSSECCKCILGNQLVVLTSNTPSSWSGLSTNHFHFLKQLSKTNCCKVYFITTSLTITENPFTSSFLFKKWDLCLKLEQMFKDMEKMTDEEAETLLTFLNDLVGAEYLNKKEQMINCLKTLWKGVYKDKPFLPVILSTQDYQDLCLEDDDTIPVFMEASPLLNTAHPVKDKVRFLPVDAVVDFNYGPDVLEYGCVCYLAE